MPMYIERLKLPEDRDNFFFKFKFKVKKKLCHFKN